MGMCNLCKRESGQLFCDPCLLTLEQFDISYRTGVKLASEEGLKKLSKEGKYARL